MLRIKLFSSQIYILFGSPLSVKHFFPGGQPGGEGRELRPAACGFCIFFVTDFNFFRVIYFECRVTDRAVRRAALVSGRGPGQMPAPSLTSILSPAGGEEV